MKNLCLLASLLIVGCAARQSSGWKTVDAGPFTFSLPLEFQKTSLQGIDSYASEYKSVGLSVNFDYGLGGESLVPLAEERNVPLTTERIGGLKVELVCFKINPFDEQQRNYQVVAGFGNSGLYMSARSETLEGCEIAREIFRTVRFK